MPEERNLVTVLVLAVLSGVGAGAQLALGAALLLGVVITGATYFYMDQRHPGDVGKKEYLAVLGLFFLGVAGLATAGLRLVISTLF